MTDIDQLTVGQVRQLAALFGLEQKCDGVTTAPSCPQFWIVGKTYFLRTVTHHYTGRFAGFNGHELILEDAAWIADDGRFSTAVATGEFAEVEPFPDGLVAIGRASIIDAVRLSTAAPRSQK